MRITVNGQAIEAAAGSTVAAAMAAAGLCTRTSVTGECRGPLCGMGICFECRATLDGKPHQRTCQMLAGAPAPRQANVTEVACELLIVGAGPAGLAAAARAAESGIAVALVDDNPAPGGQIWRGPAPGAAGWITRVQAAGDQPGGHRVRCLYQTRILDQPGPGRLRAESPAGLLDLRYQRLLLATGARERFLPFPGWTLPHVLGAGGLQAMVKGGLPIAGRRVVIAGTGPLLLAVAAYLRAHGAKVVAVCEQARRRELARFMAGLAPSKLTEGLQLAWRLRGVPLWADCWPVAAAPGQVRVRRGGRELALACDYLACGFHLVPNTELAVLLGCATQSGCVVVNERQETTVEGIYCAGEPCGIAGVDAALTQGQLAGLAAAGVESAELRQLLRARERWRGFAARLEQVCALRAELRALPRPDTLVCRCEDVTLERIAAAGAQAAGSSWRSAKLLSRCGMGACQGRVCGPALEFLLGYAAVGPRPPVFPGPLAALQ